MTPEQMRALAAWLDGYADGIEDTFEAGEQADIDSHRIAATALRAAADAHRTVGLVGGCTQHRIPCTCWKADANV
ncbi:hypothetical protein HUN59_05240 [Curtobacterium sp. Csp2]|uniref:hypothetical protein n=1 Tax=Curtobacterium sp. Csp2 TaxID=2495430 RepID=UPI0015801CCE|nr:hypothetical protein [Curtobacterium sp. Csp2]QKS15701.1 hypothetical protein HUN59_05240 [Curtobacterium sp. Csp2]